MSAQDAVGRRRAAINCLKRNMELSTDGWTLDRMVRLIVREYGYGIRDKTAKEIIEQLTKHKVIHRKGTRWYRRKPER